MTGQEVHERHGLALVLEDLQQLEPGLAKLQGLAALQAGESGRERGFVAQGARRFFMEAEHLAGKGAAFWVGFWAWSRAFQKGSKGIGARRVTLPFSQKTKP